MRILKFMIQFKNFVKINLSHGRRIHCVEIQSQKLVWDHGGSRLQTEIRPFLVSSSSSNNYEGYQYKAQPRWDPRLNVDGCWVKHWIHPPRSNWRYHTISMMHWYWQIVIPSVGPWSGLWLTKYGGLVFIWHMDLL